MSVPSPTDPADASSSRHTTRMPRALRRSLILAAARREFAVNGYHATSTAMIAQRSQCSEPTLYKHFASKLDLFLELLRERRDPSGQPWDAYVEQQQAAGAVNFESVVPALLGNAHYQELSQLTSLAVTIIDEPGVRELLTEIEVSLRENTRVAIREGQGAGRIRRDIHPDYVSAMWQSIVAAACARDAIEPGNGFDSMLPYAQTFIQSLRP